MAGRETFFFVEMGRSDHSPNSVFHQETRRMEIEKSMRIGLEMRVRGMLTCWDWWDLRWIHPTNGWDRESQFRKEDCGGRPRSAGWMVTGVSGES